MTVAIVYDLSTAFTWRRAGDFVTFDLGVTSGTGDAVLDTWIADRARVAWRLRSAFTAAA